ncbi:MAG: hypothetical protein WCH61_09515, partial [bacterium]
MPTAASVKLWRGAAPEAFTELRAWLTAYSRPLLLTHERPDGDAIGSLAGWWLALTGMGLRPVAWLRQPLPE